jgi:branched-chain amino acid transport system permease protein
MDMSLAKGAAPSVSTASAAPEPALVRLLSVRRHWRIAEIVFWLAIAAAYFLLPRYLLIINEIAILALFALSLDLILGYAGIVSLGHAAFLGLGAYAAGVLAKSTGTDPLVGLALAAAISAAVGFATSFLVLRGSDLTRLMVTLGVALVLHEIANGWTSVTGGADGLQGVMVAPIAGWFEFDLFGRTSAAYSLVTLFLLFLAARLITTSPFGLSLQAIRENPVRAAAVGVPVNRRRIAVYTLAAAYAGIAGALLAQTTQFVSLDVFDFQRSADVMLVLIIGGTGYLYGGLIGAVIFKIMQDTLATLTPQYWQFWIGLVLVVIVLVGRDRVAAEIARLRGKRTQPEARS